MTTTPLVALQKPKDISVAQIEAELAEIWRSQQTDAGSLASRSATFSMVIYEPEEFQQLLAALGFYSGPIDGSYGTLTKEAIAAAQTSYGLTANGRMDMVTLRHLREAIAQHPEITTLANPNLRGFSISDAIASQNPCRIVTLCPDILGDDDVSAQVSAYCPIQKRSDTLMCCEYITLRGKKAKFQEQGELITSLLISDLPKFTWWKATPNPEQPLFQALAAVSDCLIFDSSYFSDSEAEFLQFQELIEANIYVADLNWHRLSAWQELTAAAYDPPERRQGLLAIDRVAIDYEKGNPAQAWLFLGWLADRLGWKPISYQNEGGEHDIRRIKFESSTARIVEAELVALPVADWGLVSGDLTGVRLSSTDTQVDCATLLCSETTGCMRLEAGGGAQETRTEQVTALSDQEAEGLMTQQLQSWGRDMLYEASLVLVAEMLRLAIVTGEG